MTKKVFFQLAASGDRAAIEGRNKILSKLIFSTYEAAEEYKPEFIKLVTTPLDSTDMSYLKVDELQIEIGELELHG